MAQIAVKDARAEAWPVMMQALEVAHRVLEDEWTRGKLKGQKYENLLKMLDDAAHAGRMAQRKEV